jgi:hypothetical protein
MKDEPIPWAISLPNTNPTRPRGPDPSRARRAGELPSVVHQGVAPLGEDRTDGLAVVDLEALLAGDLQAAGVEPQLVQDRGVDVGDVVAVLDGVEAELVGGAVGDAALDPAAGQPDSEAERVVVAAGRALGAGRAAELTSGA